MGLAIIVPGISFAERNLGKVTLSGNVPISGMSIDAPSSIIGASYLLGVSYEPLNTTQRGVIWSILSGGNYASIMSDGRLVIASSANESDVVVKATSASDDSIYDTKTISCTYSEGQTEQVDLSSLFVFSQGAIKADSNDANYGKAIETQFYLKSDYVDCRGFSSLDITMLAFSGSSTTGLCFYTSTSESSVVAGVLNGSGYESDQCIANHISIPSNANYLRVTYISREVAATMASFDITKFTNFQCIGTRVI